MWNREIQDLCSQEPGGRGTNEWHRSRKWENYGTNHNYKPKPHLAQLGAGPGCRNTAKNVQYVTKTSDHHEQYICGL